ncbi:hypothetical protein OHR68_20070 [Spirillospora sp. NBC_00431]
MSPRSFSRHALHDWLTELKPDFIAAARAAGAIWEQLAPVLRVGDRRAGQRLTAASAWRLTFWP